MKPEILPAIFEVSGSLSAGRAQLIPRDLANWRQPPTLCKCTHTEDKFNECGANPGIQSSS